MRIGLIDVDGHNFPNLALMRISAYHKAQGDLVEWWWSDFFHYDIVYMSKIFSDEYSPDMPEPMNADRVIKGGTGYCIHLENGKEVFDKSKNHWLPPEVERMFPDYSLYPQYNFAVSMTSRGCPNCCGFCHVCAKEGRCSYKVARDNERRKLVTAIQRERTNYEETMLCKLRLIQNDVSRIDKRQLRVWQQLKKLLGIQPEE